MYQIVYNSPNIYGVKGFYIESEDDLKILKKYPAKAGSFAIDINTNTKYVRTEDNEWNETSTSSSSGSVDTYTKKEINNLIKNLYNYKGSVANADALPSNPKVGEVYDLQDSGMNVAWTGTDWDALGANGNAISKDDINDLLDN